VSDTSDRLTVRGIDTVLWRRARLVAVKNDLTMGQVLNKALGAWLCSVPEPSTINDLHAQDSDEGSGTAA
jgi:hypothetical protein